MPSQQQPQQPGNTRAQNTLAVVPARGGSKGIPRKNLRTLGGHTLLAYTLEAAKAAGLDRVLLSTEDEEIAALGEDLGFWVPFRRPAELALDETPTLPVVQHALETLAKTGQLEGIDIVCLLQPTSPFREPSAIARCLDILATTEADSVCTVLDVPPEFNPHWVYSVSGTGELRLFTGEAEPIPRRQELPRVVHREGSVYAVRREVIETQGSLYGKSTIGVSVDPARSVNLDTEGDWDRAEALIRRMPELAALPAKLTS